MFKKESEVIEWISNQLKFGIRPGLERLEMALKQLGNPHLGLKTVHIGGTNGKGSTVTYLRSILQEAGYDVGTYTSPFIETFNERISLNDIPISEPDLVACANIAYPVIEEINQTELAPFTEFEIITLLSFIYFQMKHVDIVIYEVGMGGRLDATNVIHPLACGITNVGHDHQEILGDTLAKLAYEKLGIVKQKTPLFTTEERLELLTDFKETALKKGSPFIEALKENKPENIKFDIDKTTFDWPYLKNINLTMKGEHQIKNATLAYTIIEYLKKHHRFLITESNLRDGLRKAFWKGRFEVLQTEPTIILDGAHNIEGVEGLRKTIETLYPTKRHIFIISVLSNKEYSEMFECLKPVSDFTYFTTFDHPKAQSAEIQYHAYQEENSAYEEDNIKLVKKVLPTLTKNDCLIITGSLYFISEMRKYFI